MGGTLKADTLRFSEALKTGFSYQTLEFHAFTVTGVEITRSKRLDNTSNTGWTIQVQPDGNGSVAIVLPATTGCDAGQPSAGRRPTHVQPAELTVSEPAQ